VSGVELKLKIASLRNAGRMPVVRVEDRFAPLSLRHDESEEDFGHAVNRIESAPGGFNGIGGHPFCKSGERRDLCVAASAHGSIFFLDELSSLERALVVVGALH
jgi:hypothetical protein